MDQLIGELAAPPMDAKPEERSAYVSKLSRYTSVKELHSERVKAEVRVIWGDYFTPDHVKANPQLHELSWKILKQASKTRQGTSTADAQELVKLVQEFAESSGKRRVRKRAGSRRCKSRAERSSTRSAPREPSTLARPRRGRRGAGYGAKAGPVTESMPIDGRSLTLDHFLAVVRGRCAAPLAPDARAALASSRRAVERAVAKGTRNLRGQHRVRGPLPTRSSPLPDRGSSSARSFAATRAGPVRPSTRRSSAG